MPGTTAHLHLPYPLNSDPIDVAGDIKKLADAVDTPVFNNSQAIAAILPRYNTTAALKADTTSEMAMVLISGNGFVPAWRVSAAAGAGWNFTQMRKFTKNTDSTGVVYISAAELNLTTILQAQAQVDWTFTMDDDNPQVCSCRIASNQVQARVYWMNIGGQIGFLPTKSVTVTVKVLGTA